MGKSLKKLTNFFGEPVSSASTKPDSRKVAKFFGGSPLDMDPLAPHPSSSSSSKPRRARVGAKALSKQSKNWKHFTPVKPSSKFRKDNSSSSNSKTRRRRSVLLTEKQAQDLGLHTFSSGDESANAQILSSVPVRRQTSFTTDDLPVSTGSATGRSYLRRSVSINSLHVVSMDDMLMCLYDEDQFEAFRAFLRKEHSEEHALFWRASHRFKILATASKSTDSAKLLAQGIFIYKMYICDGAEMEINIPYRLRNDIIDFFERELASRTAPAEAEKRRFTMAISRFDYSPLATLFDRARLNVERLLLLDSYPRFCKSYLVPVQAVVSD